MGHLGGIRGALKYLFKVVYILSTIFAPKLSLRRYLFCRIKKVSLHLWRYFWANILREDCALIYFDKTLSIYYFGVSFAKKVIKKNCVRRWPHLPPKVHKKNSYSFFFTLKFFGQNLYQIYLKEQKSYYFCFFGRDYYLIYSIFLKSCISLLSGWYICRKTGKGILKFPFFYIEIQNCTGKSEENFHHSLTYFYSPAYSYSIQTSVQGYKL